MTLARADVIAAKADATTRPNPYAHGYGSKIPTRYWVKLADDDAPRWRRVYVMCYGNAGSTYVIRNGVDTFINDLDVTILMEAGQ